MLSQLFFYLLLAILLFGFLLEFMLDILNFSALKRKMPSSLLGFYSKEKYSKSVNYFREKNYLGMIESVIGFLLSISVLYFGVLGWVDQYVISITENIYFSTLLFFAVIGLILTLINAPFGFYRTFSIEARYGFNKTTIKTYFVDLAKGILLSVIIGGGILLFAIWIWQLAGNMFWIWLWGGISIFSIFITFFYSSLIVPLFNKQTALEEGSLRDEIASFSEKAGFKLKNIYIINGSKRSTKANAYFTGFGSQKRIVLYDTLVEKFENKEIVAILAHEIGHYKHKHMLKGLISMLIKSGLMFFVLSLFIEKGSIVSESLSQAVAGNNPEIGFSLALGIIGFGIVYNPVLLLSGVLGNISSRRHEYQADAYVKKFDMGENLSKALLKLSVDSLSNMTPHPWYIFFNYSHPTVLQRVEKLKK